MDKMAEKPNSFTDRALAERPVQSAVRGKLRDIVDAPIDTHLERIEMFMDRAIRIPGTNLRFGLDPITRFLLSGGR
jgi:hypothetical protein